MFWNIYCIYSSKLPYPIKNRSYSKIDQNWFHTEQILITKLKFWKTIIAVASSIHTYSLNTLFPPPPELKFFIALSAAQSHKWTRGICCPMRCTSESCTRMPCCSSVQHQTENQASMVKICPRITLDLLVQPIVALVYPVCSRANK